MALWRTKSGERSPKTVKLALSLAPHHGHTAPWAPWAPWPLLPSPMRLDLRLLLLLAAVLMGGFSWGRAPLGTRGGGEEGGGLAPFEVAFAENSRADSVSGELAARLAQLELQVSGARGIPGWNATGSSSNSVSGIATHSGTSSGESRAQSDSKSSSSVEGQLVQLLAEQHKELQRQRLLIVESWRQIRSLRRHLKDVQGTKSGAGPRSLRGYSRRAAEGALKFPAQGTAQYTVLYSRPNCTAGKGPLLYSPSSHQLAKATAGGRSEGEGGRGGRGGAGETGASGGVEGNGGENEEAEGGIPRLRWAPRKGKYLLATCVFGRASNRLLCVRNYILAATLLQRTLILPTHDLLPPSTHARWNGGQEAAYHFDLAYNATQLNACFRTPVTVSLTRFLHVFKVQQVKVDKLLCWAPHCGFVNGKANLWPRDPKIAFPKPLETSLDRSASTAKFLSAFGGAPERILCLGDLFEGHAHFSDAPPGFQHGLLDGWHVPGQLVAGEVVSGQVAGGAGAGEGAGAGGGSGAPGACRAMIWPHEMVLSSARGFVQEVLGRRFASIHLRRDDLFRHCVAQAKCAYWPQRQAAECALAKMRAQGLELLFLASDSSNEDLALFLTMLQEPRDLGPPIRVVRLGRMQGRMWAEAVNRAGSSNEPMVVATVEKVVCAMSMLFMGTHGSTFTKAIADFRMALGTTACEDGDFCSSISSPEVLPL